MADHRSLPVPDGLEGERLDAALARLFGLSRTRAAEVIAAGDVLVDGQAGAKSHARFLSDDQHFRRAAERVGTGQRHGGAPHPGTLVARAGKPADQPAGRQRPGQPDGHFGPPRKNLKAVHRRHLRGGERVNFAVQITAPRAVPGRWGARFTSASRAYRSHHHVGAVFTHAGGHPTSDPYPGHPHLLR